MRMFHFKFEMDFVDAENLWHIFNEEICKMGTLGLKAIVSDKDEEADWYEAHQIYLEELFDKFSSTSDKEKEIISFDFVLNSLDTENVYDIIRSHAGKLHEEIMEEMCGENNSDTIDWYKKHMEYFNSLWQTIKRGMTEIGEGP